MADPTLPTLSELPQDRCCMCALAVPELLTNAHVHDAGDRTVRLCWTCHRAYDIDILKTPEVEAAERETRAGTRRVDVSAMHRQWRLDLDAGARYINQQRQHGRTREESQENARRAWDTIRGRS